MLVLRQVRYRVQGWVAVILVATLPAACGGATPTPAASPMPTATPALRLPTRSAAPLPPGATAAGVVFESPRYGYAVTLPCCWVALPTPVTAVEAVLADLAQRNMAPDLTALAERLRPQSAGQALELIAVLPNDDQLPTPVAQLTVSVLPRAGLTPAAYLEATRAEFARIAATTVEHAEIDMTLRDDQLPAVVIEYTTPGRNRDHAPIGGMQVALPSTDGNHFIVLTFTTTVTDYARLQPQFRQIVRMVELGPAA